MASINGVQIKSLKSFTGMEGPTVQGTVYLDGKRLGFWSQDGNGGPDRFEFSEQLLEAAVKSYKNSDRVREENKKYFDTSCFLFEVVKLMDTEKMFKKATKVYPGLIHATDGVYVYSASVNSTDKEAIRNSQFYKGFLEKCKAKLREGFVVNIYTSVSDFNITA